MSLQNVLVAHEEILAHRVAELKVTAKRYLAICDSLEALESQANLGI